MSTYNYCSYAAVVNMYATCAAVVQVCSCCTTHVINTPQRNRHTVFPETIQRGGLHRVLRRSQFCRAPLAEQNNSARPSPNPEHNLPDFCNADSLQNLLQDSAEPLQNPLRILLGVLQAANEEWAHCSLDKAVEHLKTCQPPQEAKENLNDLMTQTQI